MIYEEQRAEINQMLHGLYAKMGGWPAVADCLDVSVGTLKRWRDLKHRRLPFAHHLDRLRAVAEGRAWAHVTLPDRNADLLALVSAGKTRQEIGLICAVDYQCVGTWLRGEKQPKTQRVLLALAQARRALDRGEDAGDPASPAQQDIERPPMPAEFLDRLARLTKDQRSLRSELDRLGIQDKSSWLDGEALATVRGWQTLRAMERRILGKPQGPIRESLAYAVEGLRRMLAWGVPMSELTSKIGCHPASILKWIRPERPSIPVDMLRVSRAVDLYEAKEQDRLRDWALESAMEAREHEAAA